MIFYVIKNICLIPSECTQWHLKEEWKILIIFSPVITSPIYRFIFCTPAHPSSNSAMKQNLRVLPFPQHPDLPIMPNAKQETGDSSSLKRSSLPLIERDLSLLQGRRAKVSFQTTWEDNIALAATLTFSNYISRLTLTSHTLYEKAVSGYKGNCLPTPVAFAVSR